MSEKSISLLSLLVLRIRCGSMNIVSAVSPVSAGGESLFCRGVTPLMLAAKNGHETTLRALLGAPERLPKDVTGPDAARGTSCAAHHSSSPSSLSRMMTQFYALVRQKNAGIGAFS